MKKIIPLIIVTIFLNSCSENKIIYVADSFDDCEGVSSQQCFKIRESKDEEWKFLYQEIEGFDYEEGFTYKIEVNIKKTKGPAADGSLLRYKLVRIIYQKKSKVALQTKSLHGNWKVSKMMGIDSLAKSPTLIIDTESKKISGNAGCNKYGASYTIDGNIINFETPFATKMYCTNMKIEDAFFDCLSKTVYYKLDNKNLQLFSKEEELLLTCKIED
ncbi:MAG: DUF4377 domain-containing protein [Flavobacteriaceae bacterium]|nr:DUF4377 domain-containing protein [Flavobacteriaceae bacterium]